MLKAAGIDSWNDMKVGLVLSGGGAKGAYEGGALRALHEFDLADKIKAVSGTSVGALNTLVFGMHDGAAYERLWENVNFGTVITRHDKEEGRPGKLEILKGMVTGHGEEGTGLYSQSGLRELLKATVDFESIRRDPVKLFACLYDIQARKPIYVKLNDLCDEDMLDAAMASAAIPKVYDPVTFQGRLYADGGVNDPDYGVKNADVTPICPLQDMELDLLIVVHLREQQGRELDHIGNMRLLHVFPSRPLEPVQWAGTMNFTQSSIRDKLAMGYTDMSLQLFRLLMEKLK